MTMLIDDFIPQYHFREHHQTIIPAPADAVRRAAVEWQPASSFLWRSLLRLRGLGTPRGTLREWAQANGFLCLADTEDEIVYGQAGRFWATDERGSLVSPKRVEEFRALNDPRCAVAVMNVRVDSVGTDCACLYTETRVRAFSHGARRRFRLYWLLIRPFSGLLRRAMLNGIKANAMKLRAPESAAKELVK